MGKFECQSEGARKKIVQFFVWKKIETVFVCSAAPSSGVVDLFGAEPLGIFDKASTSKDILDTWSMLEKREMKLAVTHPPKNYFGKGTRTWKIVFIQIFCCFRKNDAMDR